MLARQADQRPGPFTFDEYMAWEQAQEEKWELVDGYAYRRSDRWQWDPVTGMAGATPAHNRIVSNLIIALGTRLRGGPCWAAPSDLKTRSPTGSARFPDVTVECGKGAPGDLLSTEPRVMLEVLSSSNTLPQQLRLLDDYQAIPATQEIVYVEQDRAFALVWRREDTGWRRMDIDGLGSDLSLSSIGLTIPLTEVYEGVDFGSTG